MRGPVLALALAWLLSAPSATQQPFRGAADVVSVYATVTDSAGRLVTDLSRADFEVRDDGKRQPITVFSNDLQPITIVVMLDRSFSMSDHEDLARDGATAFVKALLPGDRVRIGNFSDEIRLSPAGFTSDAAALQQVLKSDLQPAGASPVWTAIDRSITALREEPGRRVVLVFSDGYDQPARGQVVTDVKDVARRARINDIMVYAIGFPTDAGPSMPFTSRSGHTVWGSSAVKQRAPHKALKSLAEDSGGGFLEVNPYQPIARAFTRIADELHRQYWLGFTPRALDGGTHDVDVRVKRRGVTVRARRSYVAGGDVRPRTQAR